MDSTLNFQVKIKGKIMGTSVNSKIVEYVSAVCPEDAGPIQILEIRKAFLGGMVQAYADILALTELSDDDAEKALLQYRDELAKLLEQFAD